jgi:transcriptional antiterminator NusG
MASNSTRLIPIADSTMSLEIGKERLPWFALRVKSNCEKITSIALKGRAYEEFLPTYRRIQLSSNRLKTKTVELPLFPGYVFARFHPHDRLPILTLPGVLHVVGIGKEPAPLDDDEIASIRLITNSELYSEPWPFMTIGEPVEVINGPLSGARGKVLSIKDKYRLVVSLTLLQRSVAVEVYRDWVKPCPASPLKFHEFHGSQDEVAAVHRKK